MASGKDLLVVFLFSSPKKYNKSIATLPKYDIIKPSKILGSNYSVVLLRFYYQRRPQFTSFHSELPFQPDSEKIQNPHSNRNIRHNKAIYGVSGRRKYGDKGNVRMPRQDGQGSSIIWLVHGVCWVKWGRFGL